MTTPPWLLAFLLLASRAGPFIPGPQLTGAVQSLTAWRFEPFDGKVSLLAELFEDLASSVLDCARMCLRDDLCEAFTVIELETPDGHKTGCRAHFTAAAVIHPDLEMADEDHYGYAVTEAGTKTYIVQERLGRAKLYDTIRGGPCEISDHCDDYYMGCFDGKCQCFPWTDSFRYYSISGDFCVRTCSEPVRDTFYTYTAEEKNSGASLVNTSAASNEDCIDKCAELDDCRICEYSADECVLYSNDNNCACNVERDDQPGTGSGTTASGQGSGSGSETTDVVKFNIMACY